MNDLGDILHCPFCGQSAKDCNRNMCKDEAYSKVWDGECEVCGQSPTVKATGLCGPCTFGEADTAGGNW